MDLSAHLFHAASAKTTLDQARVSAASASKVLTHSIRIAPVNIDNADRLSHAALQRHGKHRLDNVDGANRHALGHSNPTDACHAFGDDGCGGRGRRICGRPNGPLA